MKLEFLLVPTSDLKASLGLYRDGLGCTEMWREGDATVVLSLPGSDVQLMLDANDPDTPVGPLFVVGSVKEFHASRPETCEDTCVVAGRPPDRRHHQPIGPSHTRRRPGRRHPPRPRARHHLRAASSTASTSPARSQEVWNSDSLWSTTQTELDLNP